MGDFATPQALLHRWEELQHDPSLRDLPYKIELNAWGKVEMSPASVRHGQLQAALAAQFARQLSDASEICVEIVSASNVAGEIAEKTRAYLAAGAQEVWLFSEQGNVRYLDSSAEKGQSAFPIAVTLPDLTKGYS